MKLRIVTTVLLFLIVQIGWGADQKEKKGDEKTQIILPNPSEGIVYALPRTVLNIKVKLIRESYRPGPYAAFAEKYLGYQGVKTASFENWKIIDIDVCSNGEADPDAVYKTFGPAATLVSLFPDGSIAGINMKEAYPPSSNFGDDNIVYSDMPVVAFPDQSSYDQYDVEVNTATGEEKIKFKTLEEKAREAADFLFRLRQKRAYTLLSPTDAMPEDGKGYEVFVQQVERLEKEYVSLFLGKIFSSEHQISISYTPGGESVKNEVLFRFSEEKGLLPKSDISGRPVTIDLIKDQKQFDAIKNIYFAANNASNQAGIYYRSPVNASLVISEGYNTLYTARMPIAQFGLISVMPELLINDSIAISFDRSTGAINYCSKNK